MSMAADWSSLPLELVGLVADALLATGDVDCYVSLRAVCRSWRDATVHPRGSDRDPCCFLPRRWVMLDSWARNVHDPRRLFLNLDTGRLAWTDLPALRDYAYVTADNDGLLILHGPRASRKLSALNPFTGASIRFPLYEYPAYDHPRGRAALAAGSSPAVMLYVFYDQYHGTSIDLNCEPVHQWSFQPKPTLDSIASVVSYQGRVYAADTKGTVMMLEDRRGIRTIVAGDWQVASRPTFLVESAGELLVVRAPTFQDTVQVFRVDIENKVLHRIKSIGNRAIFLGTRSLSVNTDNLPSIEANCIYYLGGPFKLYMHRVEDGSHEELFQQPSDVEGTDLVLPNCRRQVRPLSLPHVLMDYANYESPHMQLIYDD